MATHEELKEALDEACGHCNERAGEIRIWGYAPNETTLELCRDCAKQLARMLLEDICAIDSKGGRHG